MRSILLTLLLIGSGVQAGALDVPTLRRTWYPGGTPRLEAQIRDGVFDGTYRTWYPDGSPFEVKHFVQGREAGLQQAWTADGVLYLNYEVREGRRFGMVNARPCASAEEVLR